MATENEHCPFFNECGYVKYRTNRPDMHIPPLAEAESCGKNIKKCPRYIYAGTEDESERIRIEKVSNIHNSDPENPKTVLTIELPVDQNEINESYPVIEKNGERQKRIVGGGFRS